MSKRSTHSSHSGVATLFLIICLAVLGVVCAAMCRAIALEEHLARHERQRAQAWWLAEAGVERAVARLTADPGYTGEQWSLDAAQLGGQASATVAIEVRRAAAEGDERGIVAVAEIPVGTNTIRQTRTITWKVDPQGTNP